MAAETQSFSIFFFLADKGSDNIYLVEKNYLRAVEFTRDYRKIHGDEEAEDPR